MNFNGLLEMLCLRNEILDNSEWDILGSSVIDYYQMNSEYDVFGRKKCSYLRKDNKDIIRNEIEYKSIENELNRTSAIIEKENIIINGKKYEVNYSFDNVGRIVSIDYSSLISDKITYTYNERGFLVKETHRDYHISYSYDENGNITSKEKELIDVGDRIRLINSTNKAPISHKNTFDKCDRIISIDGNRVQYNGFHPISYKGNTLSWRGNKLIEYGNVSLQYDSMNLLSTISKGNHKTKLSYDFTKIVRMDSDNQVLDFLYDSNEQLFGFKYNNAMYFYIRDVMQNIIGIIDYNGNNVVNYSYDAYGNIVSIKDSSNCDLGRLNPFRFKGYYYVEDIGLYFLLSRFYDPEIGRFISPDSVDYLDPTSINGLNLYAYCNNDSVNMCDPSGHSPENSFNWGLFGAIIGTAAFIGLTIATFGAAAIVTSAAMATTLTVAGVTGIVSAVGGAIYGGITAAMNGSDVLFGTFNGAWSYGFMGWGAALSPLGGVISGALAGAAAELTSQLYNGASICDINWTSVTAEGVIWGTVNGLAGGLTKGLGDLFKGASALSCFELTMLNIFFIPTFDTLGLLGDALAYKYTSSITGYRGLTRRVI